MVLTLLCLSSTYRHLIRHYLVPTAIESTKHYTTGVTNSTRFEFAPIPAASAQRQGGSMSALFLWSPSRRNTSSADSHGRFIHFRRFTKSPFRFHPWSLSLHVGFPHEPPCSLIRSISFSLLCIVPFTLASLRLSSVVVVVFVFLFVYACYLQYLFDVSPLLAHYAPSTQIQWSCRSTLHSLPRRDQDHSRVKSVVFEFRLWTESSEYFSRKLCRRKEYVYLRFRKIEQFRVHRDLAQSRNQTS